MLMVGRNNLLLLDEPTNNLDPAAAQAVADALAAWPGAIILVSHDTEFVEQLAPTKVLLMPDGDVDYFSHDWLDLVALALSPSHAPGPRYGSARMRIGCVGGTINDGTIDDVVAEAEQAEADGFATYWARRSSATTR